MMGQLGHRVWDWRASPSGQAGLTPCLVSLMVASLLSLPRFLLPLPLLFWETPRESPQQERSSCGIFPSGVSHPCHTAPQPQPPHTAPGIRPSAPNHAEADPHHHTGFIGPESHRVNPKGTLLPLTPSLSGGPGAGGVFTTPILLPVPVVVGLPDPGPLRAPQILESGSAWRV